MKHLTTKYLTTFISVALAALPAISQASESAKPEKTLAKSYSGKSYSPYAKRDFPSNVYWGDTHLHTALSMDAGAFGNRLGLEEAYQFARGDEVVSSNGTPAKLSRPLDWLVIADHSDNMGLFPDLYAGKPNILADPTGKDWYERIQKGEGVSVALELISKFSQGKFPEGLIYAPDSEVYKSVWQSTIDAAEKYNDPGKFTAIIGFEWTSLIKGSNMHRVVMYRDNADKASQMVAYTTTPPLGSPNPRDLWKWLENYEAKTGGNVLAIAHNGNLSNGIMFPIEAQYDGKKLDKEYVTQRAKWEVAYETTQIKGDGEAHPFLSPDDEFADYENWDAGNLDLSQKKTNAMLAGEYAREALKNGLVLEKKFGTNPYKFGQLGSTDSHTSLATAQEDNFFGKHTGYEPGPDRMNHPMMESKDKTVRVDGWQLVASGLTAVWANENNRTSLFDAIERKEIYATTGSRMAVRMFGGWEFTDTDLDERYPAFVGYEKGVPMGGDLKAKPTKAKAPSFMVYALRDPQGGNLDRIQMIKGWMDKDGKTHEQVYNLAWSGDRKIDNKGKIPAVGNTVDVKNANWTNSIGSSELSVVWTDPNFDPTQSAFYYTRVIEIPTPRWSTYDAQRYGVDIPKGAPTSTQERAYSSPIWYTPKG